MKYKLSVLFLMIGVSSFAQSGILDFVSIESVSSIGLLLLIIWWLYNDRKTIKEDCIKETAKLDTKNGDLNKEIKEYQAVILEMAKESLLHNIEFKGVISKNTEIIENVKIKISEDHKIIIDKLPR